MGWGQHVLHPDPTASRRQEEPEPRPRVLRRAQQPHTGTQDKQHRGQPAFESVGGTLPEPDQQTHQQQPRECPGDSPPRLVGRFGEQRDRQPGVTPRLAIGELAWFPGQIDLQTQPARVSGPSAPHVAKATGTKTGTEAKPILALVLPAEVVGPGPPLASRVAGEVQRLPGEPRFQLINLPLLQFGGSLLRSRLVFPAFPPAGISLKLRFLRFLSLFPIRPRLPASRALAAAWLAGHLLAADLLPQLRLQFLVEQQAIVPDAGLGLGRLCFGPLEIQPALLDHLALAPAPRTGGRRVRQQQSLKGHIPIEERGSRVPQVEGAGTRSQLFDLLPQPLEPGELGTLRRIFELVGQLENCLDRTEGVGGGLQIPGTPQPRDR